MLQFIDNFPLKNVTTLSIGGPAKKFVVVKTEEELIAAIQYAHLNSLDHLIIGRGSNLLVSDKGVDCLVIKNEICGLSTSKVGLDSFEVRVKSGTPLQELVDYTINHGLSGLQKLTGIPGTVGGAVFGNAGAYGQTISNHLTEVVVLHFSSLRGANNNERRGNLVYGSRNPSASLRVSKFGMTKEECSFGYRDSIFKKNHDIILEVTFQLEPGDPGTLKKEAEEILSKRLIKYPPGIKCPGSFFKNLIASEIPQEILKNIPPEKIVYGKLPAGALLEAVGAKGQSVNGIIIADYHANLFINQGAGTAQAFYSLAKKYAEKVKEKFDITLEPEVHLINLPPLI